MKFEINCDIFNDYLLSILAGFIAVLCLYIDKCICCKNNDDINFISYIKIFFTVVIINYFILYLKIILLDNSTDNLIEINNKNINLGPAPF